MQALAHDARAIVARPFLSPLCTTILDHILKTGSITARDAYLEYGVTSASLARRINDLEEFGISIKRIRSNNPITGRPYTRYRLGKD